MLPETRSSIERKNVILCIGAVTLLQLLSPFSTELYYIQGHGCYYCYYYYRNTLIHSYYCYYSHYKTLCWTTITEMLIHIYLNTSICTVDAEDTHTHTHIRVGVMSALYVGVTKFCKLYSRTIRATRLQCLRNRASSHNRFGSMMEDMTISHFISSNETLNSALACLIRAISHSPGTRSSPSPAV